jgi:hypothetical protein
LIVDACRRLNPGHRSRRGVSRQPESAKRFNFNTIATLVFIGLGIGLFLIIPHQIDKPLINIGGAGQSNLDAEGFPQLLAGVFVLLGAWFLWVSFSLREHNGLLDLDGEALTKVAVTLVIMSAYVWLMISAGFVIGSAIIIFAMSTYFGNRNFALGGAISLAMSGRW